MEVVLKNPALLILAISAFAVLVALCVMWLLPVLIKRGVDVSGVISKADLAISTMNTLTDTVKTLLPGTPGLDLVNQILSYAQKAVDSAEQLYLTSQIPENQRKKEATQLVHVCLAAAGVTVTEDMKKIIDGAIEAAVFALPKTHTIETAKVSALPDAADEQKESGLLTE